MPRALLSVSDKQGLAEFAEALHELGWELISTGGTARMLRAAGLPVRDVSEITAHPELMNGRVKTLHPAVHAGILARRERAEDMQALRSHGYGPIDMVVVNLYPFHEAVAASKPLDEAMEQVDVGGRSLPDQSEGIHGRTSAHRDQDAYRGVVRMRAGPQLTR